MKELVIRYSDIDGSSKGMRAWLQQEVVSFARANPSVTIRTEKKRNAHPTVCGHYLNGNSKTICVKNQTPEEIYDFVRDLRNQIGRKVSSS
jgi:large subunit ribosomal protein L43